MATANFVRVSAYILWSLLFQLLIPFSVVSAGELSLAIAESTALQLSPSLMVENSPGTKFGTSMVCERVQIHGLPRLKGLKKFAHSVRVKVLPTNSTICASNVEICFHRNMSLGIGMCPEGQWEKLTKGLWVRPMSPFDHKLLDIRMTGSSLGTVKVSVEEEFYSYRIIFLVVGILMIMLASSLSKSLAFYYSSAMAVGVILVTLMVLFQGMRLLPTGRKNSLAIFLYSSFVGLGSFLLQYLPRFLRSVLVEIGIGEDMYYPLAIFMLAFFFLIGAWLGFWFVRKFVLAEDGSIDISTALFVAWSIRILGAIMILQSTLDPLLAAEALLCGILVSTMLRRLTRLRFLRRLYRSLFKGAKSSRRRSHIPDSSLLEDPHDEYMYKVQRSADINFPRPRYRPSVLASCSSVQGLARTPPASQSDSGTYYSTFHSTPETRKFSKDEWEKFTSESTKKALEGLVSSPDFTKWAVSKAERITLSPSRDSTDRTHQRGRWLLWF
ncbi:uncharacterized protein LOC131164969 [Malania oleifera]|uniref:uncharacterized protein LOC131164969 n=1 Tax=Malania oleifera TaxID=397392 RepID=UPI0025AE60AA|nr:uncharacterized protein LOC131164969 [Malania oleifera]